MNTLGLVAAIALAGVCVLAMRGVVGDVATRYIFYLASACVIAGGAGIPLALRDVGRVSDAAWKSQAAIGAAVFLAGTVAWIRLLGGL